MAKWVTPSPIVEERTHDSRGRLMDLKGESSAREPTFGSVLQLQLLSEWSSKYDVTVAEALMALIRGTGLKHQ